MAVTVTIAGISRSIQAGSLSISLVTNGQRTLAAVVRSMNGAWRPAIRESIVVVQDGTTIFGGTILTAIESGVPQAHGRTAIDTRITAGDYTEIADRRAATSERPAETLTTRLAWLITDYLGAHGVTLHGSQVTGSTLAAVTYDHEPISAILSAIAAENGAAAGGWAWEIDFNKKLRVFQPSLETAPFNIASGDGHLIGDVTVEPTLDAYANRISLQIGDARVVEKEDTWSASSQDTFALTYPLVNTRGGVWIDYGSGEVFETLGTGATWDTTMTALTRTAGAITGDVRLVYDAQFPIWITANNTGEQGSYGIWEQIRHEPSIFDADTGQTLADTALAMAVLGSKKVRYQTKTAGLYPGQSQSINLANRNVNQTGVITEVLITNTAGLTHLRFDVTVEFSGVFTSWQDFWTGRGSTGGGVSSGGGFFLAPSSPSVPSDVVQPRVLRLTGQQDYTWSGGNDPSNHLQSSLFVQGGGPDASYWRYTASADKTIHGIYADTPGATGQVLVIANTSSYAITWGVGTVTNFKKIITPTGEAYRVPAGGVTTLVYDMSALGWRIVAVTPRAPLVYNVRDYGAVGNGSTDDYAAITAAVTAATATGGIVWVPASASSYLISAAIALATNVSLVGAGRDASVIEASGNGYSGVSMGNGSRLANLTLRGNNSTNGSSTGLLLWSRTGCTVEDVTIEQWGDSGVSFGGSSSQHTMRRCFVRDNLNEGIFVATATDCLIDDCDITGNLYNGIDINGSRITVSNCRVYDNCLSNGGSVDIAGIGVYALDTMTLVDVKISNCYTSGNKGHGIYVQAVPGGALYRTEIVNCTGNASTTGAGIVLDAISAGAATLRFATVTNCHADSNAAGGFQSLGCSFNHIVNSMATNNTGDGFTVQDTGTQVHSCIAQANTGIGFWIVTGSVSSAVKNCIHSGNGTALTDTGTTSQLSGNY